MPTILSSRAPSRLLPALILLISASTAARADLDDVWAWMLPGERPGAAGLLATDFDGDLRYELILASEGQFGQSYYDSGYWSEWTLWSTVHQRWSSLPFESGIQALMSVPPPGDEILIVSESSLLIFDGHDKSHERTIATFVDPITDLAVADLDGDSLLEIVLCDEYDLYILDYLSGSLLDSRWGFGCTDLELGQTDADPALEIVLAGNPAGGLILDGATLDLEWDDLNGYGDSILLVDADGDLLDDVIIYRDDYYESRIAAIEPGTGIELWGFSTYDLKLLGIADVDGDPELEILVDDDYTLGGLSALDAATGASLWSIPSVPGQVQAAVVADLDADGTDELAVTTGDDYDSDGLIAVYDLQSLTLIAATTPLPPFIEDFDLGDIEGDGTTEMVLGLSGNSYGSNPPRLAIFDIPTRSLSWLEPSDPEELPIGNVSFAQSDGDSALEICLTRDSYGYMVLECQDGATHSLEWSLELENTYDSTTIEGLQLDGVGPEEVVLATGEPFVWAFDGPSGWLLWRSPYDNYNQYGQLFLGDVTGDGAPELIAGGGGYSYYSGDLVVLDPMTGSVVAGPFNPGIDSMDMGQLDADPELELVAGAGNYTSELVLVDPMTGDLSSPIATFPYEIRSVRLADMSYDGRLDYVVLLETHIEVLDGLDASPIWQSPPLGTDARNDSAMAVVELGGDSRPEILVNLGHGFVIFGDPAFAAFADGFESGSFSEWTYVQY